MEFFEKFGENANEDEQFQFTYEQTFQAALALEKDGHKGPSRELFERVSQGVPKDRASCFHLGMSYLGEDFAEAANWFGKVMARSTENDELRTEALTWLPLCFMKIGDRKQAVMCLQALHTLRPARAVKIAETLGLLNG
jgi:tetratricopeptide (TPR) repeat protein